MRRPLGPRDDVPRLDALAYVPRRMSCYNTRTLRSLVLLVRIRRISPSIDQLTKSRNVERWFKLELEQIGTLGSYSILESNPGQASPNCWHGSI